MQRYVIGADRPEQARRSQRKAAAARLGGQQHRRQPLQSGKQPREIGIVEVVQEEVGGDRVEALFPGALHPSEDIGGDCLDAPAKLC